MMSDNIKRCQACGRLFNASDIVNAEGIYEEGRTPYGVRPTVGFTFYDIRRF